MKPSWGAVEAARMEVGLKNRARNPSPQDVAAELLPACPRHHRLHAPPRTSVAVRHPDTLRKVARKRPEARHRKIREYAGVW